MRRANRAAAEILKHRMQEDRPDELKLVREAAGADVVVVSGSYDRVQDVLRAVEVKHVVIPPHLLAKLDLLPMQTLMINCPGHVPADAIAKVRDFVRRGGYLVTTDWALKLTEAAFPKTIVHNGRTTGNDVVPIHLHDANEPLLAHVKVMKDKPRWWLEGSSYPIHVVDKQLVRVLLSSEEMGQKYGETPIAVAFRVGDGKVLHMTSHFYLQQSKLVAESERQKGSSFAKSAGLREDDMKKLKSTGVDLDAVRAGELNSAYSMQQMSTNLLVEKQKANRKLLEEKFKRIVTGDVRLAPRPDAPAPPSAKPTKAGYRVNVKASKGKKLLVEDLFGNEGWVDEAMVK
jgi:hypothetical protein